MTAANDFVLWGGMFEGHGTDEEADQFSITTRGLQYQEDNRSRYTARLPTFLKQIGLEAGKGAQSRQRARKHSGTIFEPLPDRLAIRVLEVYAGDFDDDLQGAFHVCTVGFERFLKQILSETEAVHLRTNFVVSLEDGQPIWFTALSYTWGDPRTSESWKMTCGGQTFYLTENLSHALRHFRDTQGNVMLWIDQICIDQSDDAEKSQQVLLMEDVYRLARNTVAWIGDQGRGSGSAIQTLRDVNANLHEWMSPDAVAPTDLASRGLPSPSSPRWTELADFFARPYWQRCWIQQEVALSHSVHVMCGQDVISWQEVSMFSTIAVQNGVLRYLHNNVQAATTNDPHGRGCERVDSIDSLNMPSTKLSLLSALVHGRDAAATFGKDKVYGVMALCKDSERLIPDYSPQTTNEEVFREAAQKSLSPKLLYCVDHAQPPQGSPSWVPDWASARETRSLGFSSMTEAVHQAAGRTEPGFQLDEKKELQVRGRLFRRIDEVLRLPAWSSVGEMGLGIVPEFERGSPLSWEFLSQYRAFALGSTPYPSGASSFEAAWMTLVAGGDDTGSQPAPAEHAEVIGFLLDQPAKGLPPFPDRPLSKRPLHSLEQLQSRQPGRWYRQICTATARALRGRLVCRTSDGHLGIAPRGTHAGDVVAVLNGGHVPFVVREDSDGRYKLVGECYVHGIMQGEVLDMPDAHDECLILA